MTVTLSDGATPALKSPKLAADTLVLQVPSGAKSLTVRADGINNVPTYAKYSPTAVLAVGAQADNEGSRRFDLGGDEPVPCIGVDTLYFALDAGLADWNWVFAVA